jgi:hypothetical protein
VDAHAERALREAIRSAIGGDLDELAGRLGRLDELGAQVNRLAADLHEARHRLAIVERRVGVTARGPRGAIRRRHAAIELRRAGHSLRAIEVLLGVSRRTITADLRSANVSAPPDAVGVDGKPIGRRALNGGRALNGSRPAA